MNADAPKIIIRDVNFYYSQSQVLKDINLNIYAGKVTALIGASGSGKSTLLRCLNLMHLLYPGHRMSGEVQMDGINLLQYDLNELRQKVGMVFQKPTTFPMSIFNNIAFGVKLHESLSQVQLRQRVEWALHHSGLWDEVKDKLQQSGYSLSGGQQQRLCIARTIAIKPNILLLDEPTSSLDPMATDKIEQLIHLLKNEFTIIMVTHNLQQAHRISDYTAHLHMGELVEYGKTQQLFKQAKQQITRDFVTGKFG
jgi:phosphate transport system ATP-binding protein